MKYLFGTIAAILAAALFVGFAAAPAHAATVQTSTSAKAKPTPKPHTKKKTPAKKVKKAAKKKAPNSVTFRVWGQDGGSGTNISLNTDTSNQSLTAEIAGGTAKAPAWSGTLPYNAKQEYYALTAQMQGTGTIYCSITIVSGGKAYTKQGSGSGAYEICNAQLNGGFLGGWD